MGPSRRFAPPARAGGGLLRSLAAFRGFTCAALAFQAASGADPPVDFTREIKPILAESCQRCHGAPDPGDPRKRPSGNLRLDSVGAALKGGKSGKAIIPGKRKESLLYKVLLGPVKMGGREIPAMPKSMRGAGSKLDSEKVELIGKWIDQGARGPKEPDLRKLPPASKKRGLTYQKDIRPILGASCFRCHGEEIQKGGLRLDGLEAFLKGGEDGKVILPGKSDQSLLLIAVSRLDDEKAMPPRPGRGMAGSGPTGGPGGGAPPGPGGGPGRPDGVPGEPDSGQAGGSDPRPGPPPKPLTAEEVGLIRAWIAQGAK
jgi:cytochrome c553